MTVQGDRGLDLRMLWFWNRPSREEPAMLAQDLLDSDRVDEALRVTEVAMVRDPTDVDLLLVRARALIVRGDLCGAQRLLVGAATREPTWAEPWVRLGEILQRRGDEERALAVLERAERIEPGHAEATRLARTIRARRDLDARLVRFRRDPMREDPCLLTQALLEGRRLDDAQHVIDHALADDPDDADALALAARVLFARGRPESARSALERARQVAPDWREPRDLYAMLFGEPAPALDATADIDADLDRLAPPDASLDEILTQLAEETLAILPVASDTLVGDEAPVSASGVWGLSFGARPRRPRLGAYRPPSPRDLFPRTEMSSPPGVQAAAKRR